MLEGLRSRWTTLALGERESRSLVADLGVGVEVAGGRANAEFFFAAPYPERVGRGAPHPADELIAVGDLVSVDRENHVARLQAGLLGAAARLQPLDDDVTRLGLAHEDPEVAAVARFRRGLLSGGGRADEQHGAGDSESTNGHGIPPGPVGERWCTL